MKTLLTIIVLFVSFLPEVEAQKLRFITGDNVLKDDTLLVGVINSGETASEAVLEVLQAKRIVVHLYEILITMPDGSETTLLDPRLQIVYPGDRIEFTEDTLSENPQETASTETPLITQVQEADSLRKQGYVESEKVPTEISTTYWKRATIGGGILIFLLLITLVLLYRRLKTQNRNLRERIAFLINELASLRTSDDKFKKSFGQLERKLQEIQDLVLPIPLPGELRSSNSDSTHILLPRAGNNLVVFEDKLLQPEDVIGKLLRYPELRTQYRIHLGQEHTEGHIVPFRRSGTE